MIDIALDSNGDLLIENGDLVLLEGSEAVTQHLKMRLKTFLGEWFLDLDEGVPYFEQIFQKGVDPIVIDTILKEAILSTPGILEIEKMEFDFDGATRKLSLKMQARSTDGLIINFDEVL